MGQRASSVQIVCSGSVQRDRVGDPVYDVEQEEGDRKALARHLVNPPRPSLAGLDVDGYRVELPVGGARRPVATARR